MENKFFLTGLTAEQHAVDMADIFEANVRYIGGEAYLSNEGLNGLGNYFNDVPYELRGPTFERFVEELNERDIHYDVNQWKGE